MYSQINFHFLKIIIRIITIKLNNLLLAILILKKRNFSLDFRQNILENNYKYCIRLNQKSQTVI